MNRLLAFPQFMGARANIHWEPLGESSL